MNPTKMIGIFPISKNYNFIAVLIQEHCSEWQRLVSIPLVSKKLRYFWQHASGRDGNPEPVQMALPLIKASPADTTFEQ